MKPENKVNVLSNISEEMRSVLQFQLDNPQPLPADSHYETLRLCYNQERKYWNEQGPEMMKVQEVKIATKYGEIGTRVYYPKMSGEATLFYLHGGGFILGNLNTHDRIMRLLAHYTGCAVIGIDYTLSPEARFPQAIEETVAACQFFHTHSADYSLNARRIGFAGDSAGAMLAMATTLWLRDRDINCGDVMAVLLYYGLFGLRDSVTRRLYGGPWDGLTQQDLQDYENAYLADERDRESPYYCLFNNDLSRNVPPCFIAGAEFDPLIDDSRALYQTLSEHRQPCHYQTYSGTLHAFLHYSRMMKMADQALRDGADYFKQNLK
ncbi:acetyl esterase [Leminorella grimontii]|uniref:acetyl esterase n=1 Tax=Leminorella grimontii TaxID=82981 RepID=UPI0032207DF4